jgi:hypothetical protein
MDPEKRIRMAAESILENEALRQGLDEDGASALLEWGLTCARQIAADTLEFDDETAEEMAYPRMKALRKLLGAVRNLYAPEVDATRRETLLTEIAGCIPSVYGGGVPQPETARSNDFVATQSGGNGQKIRDLRELIECKPALS